MTQKRRSQKATKLHGKQILLFTLLLVVQNLNIAMKKAVWAHKQRFSKLIGNYYYLLENHLNVVACSMFHSFIANSACGCHLIRDPEIVVQVKFID